MANTASLQVPAAPLLFLSESRQQVARARIANCLRAWRSEWSALSEHNSDIALAPLDRAKLNATLQDGCCVAFAKGGGAAGAYAIVKAVGAAATLGLPSSLADECMRGTLALDLINRMTLALARGALIDAQYQPAQVEASIVSSGAIATSTLAHWWCAEVGGGITLLIAPQVLALFAPANKPRAMALLDRRRTAIAEATVRLEALLGQAEVSVGEFASLRVNDVIVLSGSLAQPIALCNASGRHIAAATLGRVEGKRAVVVTKLFESRESH